jgi:8-oxo-dGTP pyrophosphatase MutT (NUDIX family)
MVQKYTIFINEKPLYLTNEIHDQGELNFYFLEKTDIIGLIKKYFTNKISECYLFHPDEKQLIKLFKKKLDLEKAGGGIASNPEGKILFIHRNGKWDLPKGGLDKAETYEAAAVREVEEETGVKNLIITEKLQKTYHVFFRNDKYKLKVTQWYKMTTDYNEELFPQLEEGIKKVKWVKPEKIKKKLENSYENIRLLFESTL